MTKLAIIQLIIDKKLFQSAPDGPPVIEYDPDRGASWDEVKKQLAKTGASRVLLQYSNERISIPEHQWRYLDLENRRYDRLYPAADILASESPLACINLCPVYPLPDLLIQSQSLSAKGSVTDDAHFTYYFDTRNWRELERCLRPTDSDSSLLFPLSCFYMKTNRNEEAYATSLKALTQKRVQNDLSSLWLMHGLQAARCGRFEEAATAFKMSDAQRPHTMPLYCWADMLLRQGFTREEAILPIQKWLEHQPDKEERLITLLDQLGLPAQALERLERLEGKASMSLTHIRFNCLIRVGRKGEAVLLFKEQEASYLELYPLDSLLCKLLLAGEDPSTFVSALTSHECITLQERAISLRLFQEAEALQPYIADPLSYAFALFRNGYVMKSAAYFLQALKDQTLDQPGYRCLGEILYFRGAYEQASGMFEYLLTKEPEDGALRTALALSCLKQSAKLLEESMYIFPTSVFLREEAEKVAAGIKEMEQSEAVTSWRGAERMNFYE